MRRDTRGIPSASRFHGPAYRLPCSSLFRAPLALVEIRAESPSQTEIEEARPGGCPSLVVLLGSNHSQSNGCNNAY